MSPGELLWRAQPALGSLIAVCDQVLPNIFEKSLVALDHGVKGIPPRQDCGPGGNRYASALFRVLGDGSQAIGESPMVTDGYTVAIDTVLNQVRYAAGNGADDRDTSVGHGFEDRQGEPLVGGGQQQHRMGTVDLGHGIRGDGS